MMVAMVLALPDHPFLTSITLQHRRFCSLVQIYRLSLSSRPSWAFLTLPDRLQLTSVTLQHRQSYPLYRLSLPSRPSWVCLTLPARNWGQKPVSISSHGFLFFGWLKHALATSSQGHSGPLSPIEPASEKQPVRPSIDTDTASISSDYRSFLAGNSSTPGRQNSLRTKLSLPNLRRHKSKQDETSSLGSGSQTPDVDTVQVKDTDFELVRPNLPFILTRNSEDAARDGSLEPPLSLIQPGSPALSTFSNRSANGASDSASRNSPRTEPPLSPLKFLQEAEQSIDAHRQRELRWVSLMSSVLPAQARKAKKVKKLLLEGVPASVRYLVWSHVTNGRERTVAGVYAQLCSRGRVPASDSIEADIQRSFKDHPPLQGRESPVLTVLQAYLNMVPDIQYNIGAYALSNGSISRG